MARLVSIPTNTGEPPPDPVIGEVRRAICEDCLTLQDCVWQPDPFAEDIHGDDTPHWQCAECARRSAEDI